MKKKIIINLCMFLSGVLTSFIIIDKYVSPKYLALSRTLKSYVRLWRITNFYYFQKIRGRLDFKTLKTKGVRRVAIYKGTEYIDCIIDEIKEAEIEIKLIIKKPEEILIKEKGVVGLGEKITDVDAIFIMEFRDFEKVRNSLRANYSLPIISFEDMVYSSIKGEV